MKAFWITLWLALPAAADKVEGTLVQVQNENAGRVILCLKNGDAPAEPVSAEFSRCQDIFNRGLGYRWTLFCNRDPRGTLSLTSASGMGPDSATGGAFELIKRQIKLVNEENWTQALANLAPDGRPQLASFSEQWRGTLLSDQPTDWQVLCCNANRVTLMIGGSHASATRSRYSYSARRSSCNIDCQLQGFRWVISSMNP
ncbi:hypothetical protein JST97_16295 [bacterium]|nr:hypothetical protein [bacterium]